MPGAFNEASRASSASTGRPARSRPARTASASRRTAFGRVRAVLAGDVAVGDRPQEGEMDRGGAPGRIEPLRARRPSAPAGRSPARRRSRSRRRGRCGRGRRLPPSRRAGRRAPRRRRRGVRPGRGRPGLARRIAAKTACAIRARRARPARSRRLCRARRPRARGAQRSRMPRLVFWPTAAIVAATPPRTRAPIPAPASRQGRRRDVGAGDEIGHHHAVAGGVGVDVAGLQGVELREAGSPIERRDRGRRRAPFMPPRAGAGWRRATAARKPRTTAAAMSVSHTVWRPDQAGMELTSRTEKPPSPSSTRSTPE